MVALCLGWLTYWDQPLWSITFLPDNGFMKTYQFPLSFHWDRLPSSKWSWQYQDREDLQNIFLKFVRMLTQAAILSFSYILVECLNYLTIVSVFTYHQVVRSTPRCKHAQACYVVSMKLISWLSRVKDLVEYPLTPSLLTV